MYKLLSLSLAFVFLGCTPSIEPKPEQTTHERLPAWINTTDSFYAVGSSPVNFQGVYTQHLQAISLAKSDLAHNLTSYITSVIEQNSDNISSNSYSKSNALSKILLDQSYQVDAFFDRDKKLYVLVKSSKTKVDKLLGKKDSTSMDIQLPTLNTKAFEQEELMQSRCYCEDTLKSITTLSELYQNKPIWFFRPNQDGVDGAVGIAEKEEGIGFEEQKQIALDLAKSSLVKRKSTEIVSEHELLSILHYDVSGELFEASSIVNSSSKVEENILKDIWLDPTSCELYVWIIAK